MFQTALDDVLSEVRVYLEQEDLAGAVALIESMRSPDQADLFAELNEADRSALLPQLDPGDSADILEEFEDEYAARLVDSLAIADLAQAEAHVRGGRACCHSYSGAGF